jgi:GNAT superfamily N-acetyltransferase
MSDQMHATSSHPTDGSGATHTSDTPHPGRSTHATDASRRTPGGDASGASATAVRIEAATERDVPVILQMIRDLADYERMSDEVVATEQGVRESLFGPRPAAEVIMAYAAAEPAGFALFFHNYSTFLGRRGLYLEDLFVKPAFRGRGIGKRLLVELARIAVQRGCGRFEWTVLDWNAPAIGFYKSLGAECMEAWKIFRVTGDALTRLSQTPVD